MKQVARVERVLDNTKAEISVRRQSACGHSCENCSGCGVEGGVIHVIAQDPIGVSEGDQVIVVSPSSSVLSTAAAVYLLPILTFFLGYAVTACISLPILRGIVILLFTATGILPAIILDRKGRHVGYVIQEKL